MLLPSFFSKGSIFILAVALRPATALDELIIDPIQMIIEPIHVMSVWHGILAEFAFIHKLPKIVSGSYKIACPDQAARALFPKE